MQVIVRPPILINGRPYVLLQFFYFNVRSSRSPVRDIWAPPFGRDCFGATVWAPDVSALCCFSAVSISVYFM